MEEQNDNAEIYSKRIKAGKRTYFFDVKSTRSNDFYITITESKRKVQNEVISYEKHKIFLFKEDFAKFMEAMQDTVCHVKNNLLSAEQLSELENQETAIAFDEELKWE